jgi:Mrp family chromosome partitioning ATPase/predicted Fe-Mo cluster-binding NifX family protein
MATDGRNAEAAATDEQRKHQPAEDEALSKRLSRIKHKILVLSGKGGVGKSSVAAGLAVHLAALGRKVAVLDIDIHGPSIPRLLGVEGERVVGGEGSLLPVASPTGVGVMSMGLLLQGRDDAVIWRGPLKYSVIKQFLRDVEWGDLDYLIVDSPPGTGDEPLSVAQLIKGTDGALVVTTPQAVSTSDVRRSIGFARQLELPILGVIENMSGFVCPECGAQVDVFGSGGGVSMAEEMGVPFLGRIPIDPGFVTACDEGSLGPFLESGSAGAEAFAEAAAGIIERTEGQTCREDDMTTGKPGDTPTEGVRQRIAIPVTGGKLSAHFGHCEEFVIFSPTGSSGEDGVELVDALEAPPHQPGLLPAWLNERGVNIVIAGGMGGRAQELFCQAGIEVVVGAASSDPKDIARAYLDGTLVTGQNACDH